MKIYIILALILSALVIIDCGKPSKKHNSKKVTTRRPSTKASSKQVAAKRTSTRSQPAKPSTRTHSAKSSGKKPAASKRTSGLSAVKSLAKKHGPAALSRIANVGKGLVQEHGADIASAVIAAVKA